MFVVGLTGGIGSGKSAATDYFATLGIEIVDADIASRTVVTLGKPALKHIEEHFGANILLEDGNLDRAKLRQIIFSNAQEKTWLETLLHPLIREEILESINNAKSPYVILVSPLLLETNQHTLCDRILVIDAREDLQLSRTSKRDNNDIEQVRRIMASQASREERLKHADDTIENNADPGHLHQQIDAIHQHYLKLAV